jgi:hypothetical protein
MPRKKDMMMKNWREVEQDGTDPYNEVMLDKGGLILS